MGKWIDVPKELRLYKGDICDAHGQLIQGVVEIEAAWDYDNKPTSEIAYGWSTSNPWPQVRVKGIAPENAGKQIVFDAQDILDGNLVLHDGEYVPVVLKRPLREWLDMIIIDDGQSAIDMGYTPGDPRTLRETVKPRKIIWQLLTSFLDAMSVSYSGKGGKYPVTEEKTYYLGEFDAHEFWFESASKGYAMRNSGVPAFSIRVVVDGYAPPTMSLKVTEVEF